MKPAYLGIDCGSTSVKCLAIGADGCPLGVASRTYPTYSPQDGWMEQDPGTWLEAATASVRECVRSLGNHAIQAIAFSGNMSSPVFLDAACRPVYRCMLVGDARCAQQAKSLTCSFAEDFRSASGNIPDACFAAAKLLWFRDNCPEQYAKTTQFVFAKDYLRYQFTGVLNTEPTDAGNTLLYDVQTANWNWTLIREIGLREEIFPQLLPSTAQSGTLLAEVARECGLPAGIPVFCGGADMACSQLGTKCFLPDALSITLSTSGQVCMNVDGWRREGYGKVTFHPGVLPRLHYAMGSVFSGGLALNWCYKLLFGRETLGKEDFDRMNALSRQISGYAPGESGMLFLPFLSGSGTPYFSPVDRGSLLGLTIATEPARYFSAVMEGVTMHIRENADVFRDMGCDIRRVFVGGGGTHMRHWMQMLATVLDREVEILQCPDASTLGAALIALAGTEPQLDLMQLADRAVQVSGVIHPQKEYTRRYEELFLIYQSCYRAVHQINEQLSAFLGS